MNLQAIGNWFLFVGQQWASSLKVFLPNNFKNFISVTLNTWWQATKVFFKYFWWLILVLWPLFRHEFHLLMTQILKPFLAEENQVLLFFKQLSTLSGFVLYMGSIYKYLRINVFGYVLPLSMLLTLISFLFMFTAIRPSVSKKNYRYFFSYFWQYILIMLFIILVDILGRRLIFESRLFTRVAQNTLSLFSFLFSLPVHEIFISPLVIFFIFLFLDSKGKLFDFLQSIWVGLKMVFYNYPFALLSVFLFQILLQEIFPRLFFIHYFFEISYIGFIIGMALNWIIYLFYFSWFHTFYVQQRQEYPQLYS